MLHHEKLDFFAEELLHHAVQEFHSTPHYSLLHEKLQQMDDDCYNNLCADEREFAAECFALLREVHQEQERYLYYRGFQDCVSVLKQIGVLA